jgi:hypothetical protein
MTGWGIERMPRTAFPAASGMPTGDSALMPPHSQGAERRTERRAGRWALRTLVIGGLAGAAWLLSGAAAHAADRDPAPEGALLGSSLIGSVVDGDTAQPAVTRVLHAVARPLESEGAGHQHHSTASVLAVPARVLARPAATLTSTLDEATQQHDRTTDADTALSGIDRVVREITGPLRLTGGPAGSPLPVSATLTGTLRPVTGLLPHAAMSHAVTPHAAMLQAVTPHAAKPATTPLRPVAAPAVHGLIPASTGLTDPVPALGATVTGSRTGHQRTAGSTVERRHVAVEAAAVETVRETTPGGDGPAPLQVHLGAVSGISTSGSGAPTEGGSAAFLPAAVAAGTMAFHRLPLATDVEVRRHDAGAPTVSPD